MPTPRSELAAVMLQSERALRAVAIREAASRLHMSRDKRAALDCIIEHCAAGPARLSVIDLATVLGISQRTLREYVGMFERHGWIEVRRVEGQPSVYALGRG